MYGKALPEVQTRTLLFFVLGWCIAVWYQWTWFSHYVSIPNVIPLSSNYIAD